MGIYFVCLKKLQGIFKIEKKCGQEALVESSDTELLFIGHVAVAVAL